MLKAKITPDIREPVNEFILTVMCCDCPGQYMKAQDGMMDMCEHEWMRSGLVTKTDEGWALQCVIDRPLAELWINARTSTALIAKQFNKKDITNFN